jgi:hypothetical protein
MKIGKPMNNAKIMLLAAALLPLGAFAYKEGEGGWTPLLPAQTNAKWQ